MKKLKKLKKTNVFIHLNKRLGLLSQSKQVFFYVNCFVCLHSLFQNLYPVDMALSSFRIFLRVSTCRNSHSMIIIVINISAKYSFTILEINISNIFLMITWHQFMKLCPCNSIFFLKTTDNSPSIESCANTIIPTWVPWLNRVVGTSLARHNTIKHTPHFMRKQWLCSFFSSVIELSVFCRHTVICTLLTISILEHEENSIYPLKLV